MVRSQKEKKKSVAKPSGDGVMVSPKDVSYHTSIQIFQTLHLCELLHRDGRALGWLLLSQLNLHGLWLSKGLAPSAEMVSLREPRWVQGEKAPEVRGEHVG